MTSLGERLEKCYTGAVFDVLRERGITDTVLPKDLRPLDRSLVLAGPVFTVTGSRKTGLSDHETLLAWTEFLAAAPKDHVVVCAGNDDSLALMGELSAETLQYRGVKGYVTDGGCRDCDFILRLGFPVFSRFKTPRDVVGSWSADAFQKPVTIGGVSIRPGDYIICDIDGAVVIPEDLAQAVVDDVEKVMQTENLVRKAILCGEDPKAAYLKYGRF
ncbi:RraA family protein [Hoeflea sp. TYP-13]|uniref:RraA family protein n=1 Tax=Hoeflea sp. TYP-13 TaxID=3230023 RepID=UPI0034C6CDC0